MIIPGKDIAESVKEQLWPRIKRLQGRNIDAHLAVVIIGDDAASHTYVRQKKKIGEALGITVSIYTLSASTQQADVVAMVHTFNADPSVHGIIVQRPVPNDIPNDLLNTLVAPQKDVDGFNPVTPFTPPIASAVLRILEWTRQITHSDNEKVKNENLPPTTYNVQLFPWLRKQSILVIGRGVTAGKPIQETFTRQAIPYAAANSKTQNLEELCKESTIIISCAGRSNIVRHHMIYNKTILIGVGLHEEDGKLAPDYSQEEVAAVVGYYTPVPGGVGPVNVACLLENVVLAAENGARTGL